MNAPQIHDRLHELLAAHATEGLGAHETAELGRLGERALEREALAFERAAAAVHLALVGPVEPSLPASLRAKLATTADRYTADRSSSNPPLRLVDGGTQPQPVAPVAAAAPKRPSPWVGWSGWVAAAACLSLAMWMGSSRGGGGPAEDPRSFLARADVARSAWTDWDGPEVKGVTGEVVWDEPSQRGFLVLRGLPPNDPSREQYQVWIIDRRGLADQTGQSARISGAVFDAKPGETIVPIRPGIPVQGAKAFAITIEQAGGTWVSTMQRRVAIATVAPSPSRTGNAAR